MLSAIQVSAIHLQTICNPSKCKPFADNQCDYTPSPGLKYYLCQIQNAYCGEDLSVCMVCVVLCMIYLLILALVSSAFLSSSDSKLKHILNMNQLVF